MLIAVQKASALAKIRKWNRKLGYRSIDENGVSHEAEKISSILKKVEVGSDTWLEILIACETMANVDERNEEDVWKSCMIDIIKVDDPSFYDNVAMDDNNAMHG